MTKNNLLKFGIPAFVLLIIASIVLVLTRNSPPPPKTVSPVQAVVRISEDGFEPSTIRVKKGTVLVWKNDDTEAHRVAANPFPTHTDLPALDSKQNIAPGADYSFVFSDSGEFHYHDELAPKNNGTVIVE